ncbi:MAG: hypothetical protein KJI70_00695 [Patescibacteria group bacterium]|nr:hypothetical protein [Patescibacteria group bacterium]
MRTLPTKQSEKQKQIIEATKDFFGVPVKKRTIINTALWLMNRKRGVKLSDEEKNAVWFVRKNLADYRENLV